MRAKLLAMACGAVWMGTAQAAAETQGAAPNDAQIAEIVVAANQADIDAGKLAEKHASNADVKEFARTMVRDHEASNKQAKQLVTKLKVKPQPSETSRSLEKGGRENVAALKKLEGAEFDKAYIDHEVAYHQQVIDAVSSTLIPNAKNPQLKALLEKSAPVFQAHLDHARQLQTRLGAGTGTAATGSGHMGGTGSSAGSEKGSSSGDTGSKERK